MDKISQETTSIPHVVLTGDFNAKSINWGDGIQTATSSEMHLLDIANKHFLTQHVLEPTCTTETPANILDLLFSSIPSSIQGIKVHTGMSDHDVVVCSIKTRPKQLPKPRRKIYCYGKADFGRVRDGITRFSQEYFSSEPESRSVNENWTKLKKSLEDLKESFVPSKMSSTRDTIPWINTKIKRLIRVRNRIHKKAKRSGDTAHWEQFKEARKAVKRELRKEHRHFVQNIVEILRENPRGLWKYIRSKSMENQGIPTLRHQGVHFVSDKDKALSLADYFKSVFTQENLDQIPFTPTNLPTVEDVNVTVEGVLKLLKTVNINKATGPDGICPRILKETANEIAPVLRDVFQQS